MEKYYLDYLQQLETESIHIIRETAAEFDNPVMLYPPPPQKPCGLDAGLPAGQAGMRARGGMSRRSPEATEGTQKLRGMNKENYY